MRILAVLILLALPLHAEDWTVAGVTYHNVVVTSVKDYKVEISFDGGCGAPLLKDLPPDLQKRFNYDPDKAKAAQEEAAAKQAQAEADLASSLKLQQQVPSATNSQLVHAQIIQVQPDGVLVNLYLTHTYIKSAFSSRSGQFDEISDEVAFIKCNSTGYVDNQEIKLNAVRSGTFAYQDTFGATRTVTQFVASN